MPSAAASSLCSTWSSTACRRCPCFSRRPSPTTSGRPRSWGASACCCWAAGSGSSLAGCTLPRHDQDQRNQQKNSEPSYADPPSDGFEKGEVVAQPVARDPDHRGPEQAAQPAEQLKSPERHPRHAREHRAPRAQAKQKPRGDDRLVAMSGEEKLGTGQMVGSDAEEVAEPFDKRAAAAIAQQVSDVSPGGRAHEAEQDDDKHRVVSRRGPRPGDQKKRIAGKRDARTLDEDAEAGGRVPERVDDPGPIHEASYT